MRGFNIIIDKNHYQIKFKKRNKKEIICEIYSGNCVRNSLYQIPEKFTGKAKCNFEDGDVFDRKTGEKLALLRALEKREIYIEKELEKYIEKTDAKKLRVTKGIMEKLENMHRRLFPNDDSCN